MTQKISKLLTNIEERGPLSRNIFLNKNVDEESSFEIIKAIVDINQEDDDLEEELKEHERKDINLHINTNGGSIYDCLGIIAAMEQSKTKINTICYGYAFSAGFIIFISGHYRKISRHATLMWHEGWDEPGPQKLQEIKENAAEFQRLMNHLYNIMYERTKVPKALTKRMIERKLDVFFSQKDFLKYKLADEIL